MDIGQCLPLSTSGNANTRGGPTDHRTSEQGTTYGSDDEATKTDQ